MKKTSRASKLRDKEYYRFAHKGSKDLSHPAMRLLVEEVSRCNFLIDLGCGEGTRLHSLIEKSGNSNLNAVGVDISRIAIDQAKHQYSEISFFVADLEKLSFTDSTFDLVYSAFVFEHLENPEQVLKEAIRLVKPDGKLIIVAPNFGAPNRRSPNSSESKLTKLISGFLKDFSAKNIHSLGWQKVEPKFDSYVIDADTTVEPYLGSLIKYAKSQGLRVGLSTSLWDQDKFSFFQLPFKLLGMLRIYPFAYWGPHLLVELIK